MSPSWIWSDKITNERVARVGYNHFISNEGEWNNCFSNFSNRVLPPIFISTILQSGKFLNRLAHYFPYDVKLPLLAHSRSFLANQKARNAIVGAENLLRCNFPASIFEFLRPRLDGDLTLAIVVLASHFSWICVLYYQHSIKNIHLVKSSWTETFCPIAFSFSNSTSISQYWSNCVLFQISVAW